MGMTLHVFKHVSSDLATATPDRSGRPLLACHHPPNASDWKYLDNINEDDIPSMVSNHREFTKSITDNNFFHLDKPQRVPHAFYTKHGLGCRRTTASHSYPHPAAGFTPASWHNESMMQDTVRGIGAV
jgi:hypothetical protein